VISINNISLSFGERILFDNISFLINSKDRIGLVGKNGVGKTTLLKVIIGEQSIDSGKIDKPNSLSIGYLPQQMKHIDGKLLFDEVKTAFSEILYIEREIDEINEKLNNIIDHNDNEFIILTNKLHDLHLQYEILEGQNIDARIEKVLFGLGFLLDDFKKPTSQFSGGWRMRIELAKTLLKPTQLLLLDEPTNHLDIESIQWLENFLAEYSGAVIVISHDKLFLDNVTSRTIEISLGKIYDYKANYSTYKVLREERRQQQIAAYRNQQKMIEETEQFIERFRYKATKAVQVQSRIKQLAKLEKIEIDEEDYSSLNIKFPPAPRSGDIVIDIKNLSKSYENKVVIKNIDFSVKRGDRIAFVGKNGEGKTTLSRIIVGELDYEGFFKIGHNVEIGYFAQNQDEIIDESLTVFETIDLIAVGEVRTKLRTILGAFLFRDDDIDKKVKVLSGGERSRLALIKLLLKPYNLLVLDEPTNHLDMHSKDVLKQALLAYNGTLIVVSHDRDFLNGLVDKIYEFKNQRIYEHLGSISDFLKKRKIENLNELEKKQTFLKNKENKNSSNKEKYLEKKEFDRSIKKINNRIADCEKEIDKIEQEIKRIEHLFQNPENFNNSEIFKNYEQLKIALEQKMNEWEFLNSELQNMLS
jgi:ATP-binding cassette subfamily F protein 3